MNPMQLLKNPLFQIFIKGQTGDVEKRPFKEENPFSKMFGSSEPEASAASGAVEGPATDAPKELPADSAKHQADGHGKKKKKRQSSPSSADE